MSVTVVAKWFDSANYATFHAGGQLPAPVPHLGSHCSTQSRWPESNESTESVTRVAIATGTVRVVLEPSPVVSRTGFLPGNATSQRTAKATISIGPGVHPLQYRPDGRDSTRMSRDIDEG